MPSLVGSEMCIRDRYLTSLKVCDWSGHIFGASASPRSLAKKMAMPPSSTVHGGQHDTEYAAFVADEISGFMLEPARTRSTQTFNAHTHSVRLGSRHEDVGGVRPVERHDENLAVRPSGGKEMRRGLVGVEVEAGHSAGVALNGGHLQRQTRQKRTAQQDTANTGRPVTTRHNTPRYSVEGKNAKR